MWHRWSIAWGSITKEVYETRQKQDTGRPKVIIAGDLHSLFSKMNTIFNTLTTSISRSLLPVPLSKLSLTLPPSLPQINRLQVQSIISHHSESLRSSRTSFCRCSPSYPTTQSPLGHLEYPWGADDSWVGGLWFLGDQSPLLNWYWHKSRKSLRDNPPPRESQI